MALLNRKVDYAILVLSHLHEHPAGGAARAIAERFGLSRGFVANILKELCYKGFVTSHRGVKGGYALAPGASRQTLADLIETLDESFRLAECNHADGADCAVFGSCTMRGPIATVHGRIIDVLRGVTLADLFGANGEIRLQIADYKPRPQPEPTSFHSDFCNLKSEIVATE
ncbi:MAG: RrF2 family transcriptional regulator [Gemmataceae bacterium]